MVRQSWGKAADAPPGPPAPHGFLTVLSLGETGRSVRLASQVRVSTQPQEGLGVGQPNAQLRGEIAPRLPRFLPNRAGPGVLGGISPEQSL